MMSEVFENVYVRTIDTEDMGKVLVVSNTGFDTLEWNVSTLDDVSLQGTDTEDMYVLTDGDEVYNLKVEPQVHVMSKKSWQVCKDKVNDDIIKLNGHADGTFHIFKQVPPKNSATGMKKTWKAMWHGTSEKAGIKAFKELVKELKAEVKEA